MHAPPPPAGSGRPPLPDPDDARDPAPAGRDEFFGDPAGPPRFDLAVMLAKLRPRLRRAAGKGIDLRVELAASRWLAVDPAPLDQVLFDLILNARDAMPRGGTLLVRTDDVDVRPDAGGEVLPAGSYVALTVSDDGTGMTTEVLASAIDPFFTTKPAGQGTGLGLSTVDGIVREMGGALALDSEFGAGTSVRILLPAHHWDAPV